MLTTPPIRALLAASFALGLVTASAGLAQESRYQQPPTLADGWKTATPESLGVDPSRLAVLTASVRGWPEPGVHAILIERSGHLILIYEEYSEGFDQKWGSSLGRISMTRARGMTSAPSPRVVSALAGRALGEGALPSLEQPVIEWFPEYQDLNTTERRRVILAHVHGFLAKPFNSRQLMAALEGLIPG